MSGVGKPKVGKPGKKPTTTQRIYVEDWEFIKAQFRDRLEKPTAADAFHEFVKEYKRLKELNRERKELIYRLREELEEKERIIKLKIQELIEAHEANKALQRRVEEREQSLNNCLDQLAELRSSWLYKLKRFLRL